MPNTLLLCPNAVGFITNRRRKYEKVFIREDVLMILFAKLVLTVAVLTAQGVAVTDNPPKPVTIIDPEQDKVIRAIPSERRCNRG